MSDFSGLIPPICTPLTPDGDVDVASLRDHVEFLLGDGATGIFALGSSGEAIYLDDKTRSLVARTVRDAVGGRVPVLLGVLAPTPARVLQQIELLGPADALVATAPFYAQLSTREVAAHFRMVAAASLVPLLAYDIPGSVGYKLDTAMCVELLADGTLAGLKDSSGDVESFGRIAGAVGPDVAVLSGADTLALAALDAGAHGLVPGLSNIRPDLFAGLIAARHDGDTTRAVALQNAITALNAVFWVGQDHGLGLHASQIGALKEVLAHRGVIRSARLPQPLEPFPAEAREAVIALVQDVDRQLISGGSRA